MSDEDLPHDELERLERDLALEADTRKRLNAMNEQFLKVVQELEEGIDDVIAIETEEAPSLTERLRSLVRQWAGFKQLKGAGIEHRGSGSRDG